jgi:hypothetical protein
VGKIVPLDGQSVLAVCWRGQVGTREALSVPLVAVGYAEAQGAKRFVLRDDRSGVMRSIELAKMRKLGWVGRDGELYVKLADMRTVPWASWPFAERTIKLAEPTPEPERQPVATQLELEALRARAAAAGIRLYGDLEPPRAAGADELEALSNWRGLFSHDGEPYTSLDRTLMNLPGGIPSGLVCKLHQWRLERPHTERLPLLAMLLYADPYIRTGRAGTQRPIHADILGYATTDEWQRAIVQIGEHVHASLSHRRTRDVRQAVQFLADYPERHRGRLGGLVDKAIRWHRHDVADVAQREVERLGADTPTARPQALPEIPGVRFLESVGAVCAEGVEMRHCVGSYVEAAVRGYCYLFHVSHGGDVATVELAPGGQVAQAHGPRNYPNEAATWGRRALARWAKQADLGEPQVLADPQALARLRLPQVEEVDYDNIPF